VSYLKLQAMTEDQIYTFLDTTFRAIFKRENIVITPKLSAADVEGWDSFAQISIVVAAEEHFSIEFRSKELDGLKNVGDFVTLILQKTEIAG